MKQFEDQEHQETTWVNDSNRTAAFNLMLNKKGRAPFSSAFRIITLKPGQKITLSSEFDDAIRTEDKNGRVIGGLCPWLKKEGEEEIEMEDCLDFEAVAERLELEKLAIKAQKDKALEEAVRIQAEQKAAGIDTTSKKRGRPAKGV